MRACIYAETFSCCSVTWRLFNNTQLPRSPFQVKHLVASIWVQTRILIESCACLERHPCLCNCVGDNRVFPLDIFKHMAAKWSPTNRPKQPTLHLRMQPTNNALHSKRSWEFNSFASDTRLQWKGIVTETHLDTASAFIREDTCHKGQSFFTEYTDDSFNMESIQLMESWIYDGINTGWDLYRETQCNTNLWIITLLRNNFHILCSTQVTFIYNCI